MDAPLGALPFELEQGEHVSVIGDTGTGKTTLIQAMLDLAPQIGEYVIALRYKPDKVVWRGYQRVRTALPALESIRYKRILLEPRPTWAARHREFTVALDRALYAGQWTVVVDDLFNVQKLGPPIYSKRESLIDDLLTAGRSKGNTVITAQQLPVDATSYAIAEARLTVSFMLGRRHAKVLAEKSSEEMGDVVQQLGDHEGAGAFIAMFWRPTREVWAGRLVIGAAVPRFDGQYVVGPRAPATPAAAGHF